MKAVQEALKSKPNNFLKKAIGHAILFSMHRSDSSRIETILKILLINPNLFDLVLPEYPTSPPVPTEVRPQRLTIPARSWGSDLGLTHPMFSSVTHLTLLQSSDYSSERWERWSPLATLPALTHLCFTANVSRRILPQLLGACSGLHTVVTTWLTRAPSRARVDAFSYVLTTPDPRVVVTDVDYFYDGWEKGAWTGNDLWARVDDFIARKRRGEIEGGSLFSAGPEMLIQLY
jgi:hypothetical protein